jgi:addiction module HigA family antidote
MLLPTDRSPTPPGELLLEEFLRPRGITQVELARRMGVPIQRVNTIVNGKRGITADTAILLAEVLGTTPELWMNLQGSYDLWNALRRRKLTQARRASPKHARSGSARSRARR